ncbi:enoyl-CoA hydratase-related protein [Bradyrhizobium sp. USDA 4506]
MPRPPFAWACSARWCRRALRSRAPREIARKLAAKSPIVMKIGRDAFMRAVDADFRRSVENTAESFVVVASTEDCQEGLNAFVEKRAPNYKGR